MQFTLKRLLIATALIAVGCFGISLMPRWDDVPHHWIVRGSSGLLIWTSLGWIGAGVGLLFGRCRECAGAGVLLTIVFLPLLFGWG
jgi:hypothetical protein